jgi:hypothetical protein
MKYFLLAATLLLAGNTSWADPVFHKKCAYEAWNAAKPTQEQKDSAHAIFAPVKKMYADNKDQIKLAKDSLVTSFKAFPIVKSDVESKCEALYSLLAPLKKAMLFAAIDSINLLTQAQRLDFDAAMKSCKERNKIDTDPTDIEWEPTPFVASY